MIALDKTAGAFLGGTSSSIAGTEGKVHDSLVGVSRAMPFAGAMHTILDQANELSMKADQAVTGLLNGKGVEIHDVMIAQQKSGIAFDLALQVRNKAVAAYQQMLGMQF